MQRNLAAISFSSRKFSIHCSLFVTIHNSASSSRYRSRSIYCMRLLENFMRNLYVDVNRHSERRGRREGRRG